jgi:transcriptional regulator GlxA family with amidase domain
MAASTAGTARADRMAPKRQPRLSSLCVGAFALGEAGLLDGRRVTTHWQHTEELQVRFPQAKVVDNQLFVADGTIWSSGGMTVCVDVALEMVERDLGREIALR